MLPFEKKLLKPNPAGCWQFVPAMMHGLLVLCGPTVLPCIGPTSVSGIGTAEAVAVSANVAAVAATPIHAKRILPNMVLLCLARYSTIGLASPSQNNRSITVYKYG